MVISEACFNCQKRHLFDVKKGSWQVRCDYISKELFDNDYYPLEEALPEEEYKELSYDEKVQLQYRFNKLLWAKHKLDWSVYNSKRKQDQFWQKETLLCSAKSKVCRFGRRMGPVAG